MRDRKGVHESMVGRVRDDIMLDLVCDNEFLMEKVVALEAKVAELSRYVDNIDAWLLRRFGPSHKREE